jgi:hypothetical protein
MLKWMTIADFDVRLNIFSITTSGTGQSVDTISGSATYSNIWAKEVKSNLTDDKEQEEFGQVTGIQKRSWVIRQTDKTITNRMIIQLVGVTENYHIIAVHPYGSDRELVVIETMSRDND